VTEPLLPPAKKNPQRRATLPTLPPFARSGKGIAFTVAAAEGRFALQVCGQCDFVSYPWREICPRCWSMELDWRDVVNGGTLLADTVLRTSINTYFRERVPWRVGTVQLDAGPTVLSHVHGDVGPNARVRMIARTDKSGQGVLFALPETETPNMADDKQLRTLTCDPRHRRVLVTDGRTAFGQRIAKAASAAGASTVFVGIAEDWRPYDGRDELLAVPNVDVMPLDITDTASVNELAAEIGGKTDILINSAEYVRPGATMERDGIVTARDEMEINYFGLMRLIQAFGPAMRARGADGDNSACAWVNLLSVYALSNWPAYGTASASQAAAFYLSQCLRGEFAGSGVKVVNVLCGPLDESWRQPLPPPKVTPEIMAAAVIRALQQGLETVALGPVAEDVMARWRREPAVLERELVQIGMGTGA